MAMVEPFDACAARRGLRRRPCPSGSAPAFPKVTCDAEPERVVQQRFGRGVAVADHVRDRRPAPGPIDTSSVTAVPRRQRRARRRDRCR